MKTNHNPFTVAAKVNMRTYFHFRLNSRFIPAAKKMLAQMSLCGLLVFSSLLARSQATSCCDQSFGEVTLYYSVQPGSTFGFGMEGGNWNKEASRFSYFLGTRMQWYR